MIKYQVSYSRLSFCLLTCENSAFLEFNGGIMRETNFMCGYSYSINELDTLKMVTASSIFGEPQYYRDGEFVPMTITDGLYEPDALMVRYLVEELDKYKGMKTSQVMESVIDAALCVDYKAVLDWAVTLREEYLMRLNPQVIMVRAALFAGREAFTKANPGYFYETEKKVLRRGDDVISQISYFLYINKGKNRVPGILKRSWNKCISSMDAYSVYKYQNHGIGLIDAVRISHANSHYIDELMRNGRFIYNEEGVTWEHLRAEGNSWQEIIEQLGRLPHMALLRNLRGIFAESISEEMAEKLLKDLKTGVKGGMQFPFRYYTAYNALIDETKNNPYNGKVLKTLEECLDISCEALPKLKGKNAFLSDNSGSAWGTINSEYGTVRIAQIDNLSSIIGCVNSEEGHVFAFGDELKEYPCNGAVLETARKMSVDAKETIGQATENGIWLFFHEAITKKEHWDNIFVFSDMQAGHGGLYGTAACVKAYVSLGFGAEQGQGGRFEHIDVAKLVEAYREKVNPKVNVYCVQTAGYTNVLLPEYAYRFNVLYGWTGKELVFADMMNKFWDRLDAENPSQNI